MARDSKSCSTLVLSSPASVAGCWRSLPVFASVWLAKSKLDALVIMQFVGLLLDKVFGGPAASAVLFLRAGGACWV